MHHQGTIYEAAASALPVFVAIAEWRDHPDRADAIEMLHHIALACGVVVWRWEGDEMVYDAERHRQLSAEVRDAVRAAADSLLARWRTEPEDVRRALVLLLATFVDLHERHGDLLEETLPPEHRAGFRAVVRSRSEEEVDA